MTIEKKAVTAGEERVVEDILKRITELDYKIVQFLDEKRMLQRELLEIKIAPFKIGDDALAEIPSGRSTQWKKCLLECENGILYVRPYLKDGSLSSRHFILYPSPFTNSYLEYLKEVE